MRIRIPALNLKAKLIALMVVLLALTLGAEAIVSLRAQQAVVETTQAQVKDLASAIEISVQELTSVGSTDRDRLQNFVKKLRSTGLEVSIASNQNLIINSSNPRLIGMLLKTDGKLPAAVVGPALRGHYPLRIPAEQMESLGGTSTVYMIPVEVEDHLMGYVYLQASFGDFAQPLEQSRKRLIWLGLGIFALGLVFSYFLAQRYVQPIHAVAAAAHNIAERGLEPVAEAQRRDEIGLLTRSFNEMVSQLRRAREREQELNRLERFTALGQLAGGLAHEIKNPLNFISLAIDQLRARYASQLTQDRENFLKQLAMMKGEIHRLTQLMHGFLQYGKPIEIYRAPTDLHALVDGVLALSESKLRSQAIEVIEEGRDVAALLNVDAEKLRICFVNVIANATQAMPEGGRLKIAFARRDSWLVITFSDTGPGIDPELAERVFEPFFSTKREGIGLGLFLSKTIVEKHDGTISIARNEPGPGTTVTVSFPLSAICRQ